MYGFECTFCKLPLVSEDSLLAHFYEKHQQEPDVEKVIADLKESMKRLCNICGSTLKNDKSFRSHSIKLHGQNIPSSAQTRVTGQATCHICGAKLSNATSVRKHIALVHTIDEEPSVCSQCDISFPNKAQLQKHISRQHLHTFMCDECGQTFTCRANFRYHMKKAHLPITIARESNKIRCQFCRKMIARSNMTKHVRIHHHKKHDHKCTYPNCTKSFNSHCLLQYHINDKHLAEKRIKRTPGNPVPPEPSDDLDQGHMDVDKGAVASAAVSDVVMLADGTSYYELRHNEVNDVVGLVKETEDESNSDPLFFKVYYT